MTIYRHKKRGTTYEIVGKTSFQTSDEIDGLPYTAVYDNEYLVVYKSTDDGKLYARTWGEFFDGRFEEE